MFFFGLHVSTDFDPADCARGLLTLIKSWLKGHGLWKCGFMPNYISNFFGPVNFCQMRLPPAMAQVSYVHITWTNRFCCSPSGAMCRKTSQVLHRNFKRLRFSTISMWGLITKYIYIYSYVLYMSYI